MSLHQSQHELAISRSSILSPVQHSRFPKFVNDGDILIYKKDKTEQDGCLAHLLII